MKKTTNLTAIALATTTALGMSALPMSAQAELSGNISVVSKYVLRGGPSRTAINGGAANEHTGAAVQGGLDYGFDNGIYLGYWGSSLSYADTSGTNQSDTGFENDFYGGYAGSVGSFNYDIGVIAYDYVNISNSDAQELVGSVGYGPVSLGFKSLLKDVAWGNDGDTYWTLSYETDLPKDFSLGLTYGYYTYDSGTFVTGTEDGFKHLDIALSHPIGKTGADMSIVYIVGGDDRTGAEVPDNVVFGVSYGFDI